MAKIVKEYWESLAKAYFKRIKYLPKTASYGPYMPEESKLKLIGNVTDKKILDVGCGAGQASIAFAKQGAHCTGIDISEEQLKYAKALARQNKVNIRFIQKDAQNLKGIKSSSQDVVFSSFAFQYVPNLTPAFKEVHRVLKNGGLFVFSLDHPFNHTVSMTSPIPKKPPYKLERSYYKTGKVSQVKILPDGTKQKFVIYSRKVSDIYNSLVEANFLVEKILEPLSLESLWRKTTYPKELAKLIGPGIIFKAKKA
jgi:ubiquinone/menaquinone biosynthesis C-methylase UbiE